MTDTYYLRLPLRRIVRRFTYYSPELPPFPVGYFIESMIVLECGHEERSANQKSKARCGQCAQVPTMRIDKERE